MWFELIYFYNYAYWFLLAFLVLYYCLWNFLVWSTTIKFPWMLKIAAQLVENKSTLMDEQVMLLTDQSEQKWWHKDHVSLENLPFWQNKQNKKNTRLFIFKLLFTMYILFNLTTGFRLHLSFSSKAQVNIVATFKA